MGSSGSPGTGSATRRRTGGRDTSGDYAARAGATDGRRCPGRWCARDVALASHRFAVEVRLSDHEIVVTRAGRAVLTSDIGVGTQDTPTPGGDYYVKELLAPPDPTGVYGPYAYGLSGFSNVLTDFAGGDGVIGIHGTDRPDLVGTDVSSGCIRLSNDVITALVEEIGLPLGTPVTILA